MQDTRTSAKCASQEEQGLQEAPPLYSPSKSATGSTSMAKEPNCRTWLPCSYVPAVVVAKYNSKCCQLTVNFVLNANILWLHVESQFAQIYRVDAEIDHDLDSDGQHP